MPVDATAWVAFAGILGTLAAALLGPFVAEQMRRKSARLERLVVVRIDLYADLLRATARLVDNAATWSALPLADLEETDNEELNRLIGRVRAVASEQVYKSYQKLASRVHEFNRLLPDVKQHHHNLLESEEVDDLMSIHLRMTLATIADAIRENHLELEDAVRAELRS